MCKLNVPFPSIIFLLWLIVTCNGKAVNDETLIDVDMGSEINSDIEKFEKDDSFDSNLRDLREQANGCKIEVPCGLLKNRPFSGLSNCLNQIEELPLMSSKCGSSSPCKSNSIHLARSDIKFPTEPCDASRNSSCSQKYEKPSLPAFKPYKRDHKQKVPMATRFKFPHHKVLIPMATRFKFPHHKVLIPMATRFNLRSVRSSLPSDHQVLTPIKLRQSRATDKSQDKEIAKDSCPPGALPPPSDGSGDNQIPESQNVDSPSPSCEQSHTFIPYREEIDVVLPKDNPCLCPCSCT